MGPSPFLDEEAHRLIPGTTSTGQRVLGRCPAPCPDLDLGDKGNDASLLHIDLLHGKAQIAFPSLHSPNASTKVASNLSPPRQDRCGCFQFWRLSFLWRSKRFVYLHHSPQELAASITPNLQRPDPWTYPPRRTKLVTGCPRQRGDLNKNVRTRAFLALSRKRARGHLPCRWKFV
jgi:hypothetical protein